MVATIVVAAAVTVCTAGAASPLLAAAIAGAAGGFAGGSLGAALENKDFWQCMGAGALSGAVGAVAGMAGFAVGGWTAGAVNKGLLNLGLTKSPVLNGIVSGAVGGAAGGFAGGFTAGFIGNLINGGDFESACKAGLDAGIKGAEIGAAVGGVTGGYGGWKYAKDNKLNPWTGDKLDNDVKYPDGWTQSPSNKGGGVKYTDPNNPHNNMRVMPGNPNSPNPAQQDPYVIYKIDGIPYDVNGNPLPSSDIPAAHIPADQLDINKMPK